MPVPEKSPLQNRLVVAVVLGIAIAALPEASAAAGAAPGSGFTWSAFLGPFHMVFLHFPIGILTLAGLLELLAAFRPFEGLRRSIGTALALGVGAAALTAVLGLFRAEGGGYSPDILGLHRNLGLAMVALATVALGLHAFADRTGSALRGGYRVALAATLGLLMAAGHQGGTLTHGRGFLSENSPAPIRRILEGLEPSAVPGPAPAAGTNATATADTDSGAAAARRILGAKCVSCHGPEKQKGKFRVDQREALLKGGSSGEPAVVPGDPGKSYLVRLLLLPRGHDDAMPPDGKDPLTGEETLTILRWVQAGAR